MKATARVIRGSVRAKAWTVDMTQASAYSLPTGIMPMARPTEESWSRHFLYVAPEEPQQLVWLVPQYGVDYDITASTNLDWNIE